MAKADDAFVREHEDLVRGTARRVVAQLALDTSFEDLVAYGMQGLIEARQRFDPSRGVPFTAFAHYRIRGAIIDGVRQMARLPRRVHVNRRAAEALDAAAEQALEQRADTPDAVETLKAIDDILGKTSAAFILAAVGQAEDTPADAEEKLVSSEERSRVALALETLPERERLVIEQFYFRERTLEAIGKDLGITKSWTSRLHTRALGLLRQALGEG